LKKRKRQREKEKKEEKKAPTVSSNKREINILRG
jgi:hypothetical protein